MEDSGSQIKVPATFSRTQQAYFVLIASIHTYNVLLLADKTDLSNPEFFNEAYKIQAFGLNQLLDLTYGNA